MWFSSDYEERHYAPNEQRRRERNRDDMPGQSVSRKPQQDGVWKLQQEMQRDIQQAQADARRKETGEIPMDDIKHNEASENSDKKRAIPIDEVIYDRGKEQADGQDMTDETEIPDTPDADDVTEDDYPDDSDGATPNRSFMDEMFDNGEEFADDDYIDMPSYDELVEENAKLQRQLASVITQYESLKKDWNNYRKRAKLEVERSKNLASERVATQIIPVIDDLKRSIDHIHTMGEGLRPLANGNEAISNRIVAALAKEGIEVISPLGEPFDVNRHQAIAIQEVEGKKPGLVFHVYQDGYAIGDRVIRPASVGVTK